MATEQGQSHELDLERTDRLPILVGTAFDPDVIDDAVPLPEAERVRVDYAQENADSLKAGAHGLGQVAAIAPGAMATTTVHADFIRPSSIDLPSLAESVRSVEERIARQQAEYEVLNRNFERAREAEAAAVSRAAGLERELTSLRSLLELEQSRVREHEKALAERLAAAEAARSRTEGALLESERHQSEAKTLKDALASRDATIVQVLHSLGERDAQLAALQQEHAKAQQALELRGKSNAQLEAEIDAAHAKSQELTQQLHASTDSAAALAGKLKRAESEVNALRAELGTARAASNSYLEVLRTREFRRGFDETLLLELDAQVGAADAGHSTLRSERDRLQSQIAARDEQLQEQSSALEKLHSITSSQAATVAKQSHDLKQSELARAELAQKLSVLETERARLAEDLKERTSALAEARAAASGDVQRITQQLAAAEQRQSEQAAQIAKLQTDTAAKIAEMQQDYAGKIAQMQSDHLSKITALQTDFTAHTSQLQTDHAAQIASLQTQHKASVAELAAQAEQREQEMSVLMAHLQEARRPVAPIEAEVKRLSVELAEKTQAFDELNNEAQQLRASLERTRGALEEREFLIRRLERAESNNANVLGRIQTSMERLGSAPIAPPNPPQPAPEWFAELVRVDGERSVSHALGRRTRIGRGAGCELQVNSTSVSRHHALIVAGPRETIIEDLNSTNGVIVNGRKISRAFLNDGDVVIVGDVQFRYVTKTQRQPTAARESTESAESAE